MRQPAEALRAGRPRRGAKPRRRPASLFGVDPDTPVVVLPTVPTGNRSPSQNGRHDVRSQPPPPRPLDPGRARAAAYVGHTHIRLRGEQTGTIGVCNARTATASISLRLGTALMTFWSAAASQGVLEAVAAARNGLTAVPDTIAAAADPYGTLAIAVDWTTPAQLCGGSPKPAPPRTAATPCAGWTSTWGP